MSTPRARSVRVALVLLASVVPAAAALAQECPGLPTLAPPTLEKCPRGTRGAIERMSRTGCHGRNADRQDAYNRLSRSFATGMRYNTAALFTRSDLEPRVTTTDSLRGCRGEGINIEITPGKVTLFEYELVAPSGVTVARGAYDTRSGDRVLGDHVTLPETGYYLLRTRTTAPAVVDTLHDKKKNKVEYLTAYPRDFRVSFRTDAAAPEVLPGDRVEATVTTRQPFARRVRVKGGTKVRLRASSMGTGDFVVRVLRASGEELHRADAPAAYWESPAFSPRQDETLRVEVRGVSPTRPVGLQFSVEEDGVTGEAVTIPSRVASAFKLPAFYTADAHPGVAASERSRLLLNAAAAQTFTLTVRPSQLAGLSVRVRVYNVDSEELALRTTVVSGPTPLPVTLSEAGSWIIELTPLAATELAEAGEAKYTVELTAGVTRPARRAP